MQEVPGNDGAQEPTEREQEERMTTQSFNANTIEREWVVVDVAGLPLGRAAARIAAVLRGKHKPTFTSNADCGDFVIVVNAAQIHLTGSKSTKKLYYRHSGYFGSLRSTTAGELLGKNPSKMIELAIKGMLPKGPLGRRTLKKLKVYAGAEHPHQAQQPKPLTLNV